MKQGPGEMIKDENLETLRNDENGFAYIANKQVFRWSWWIGSAGSSFLSSSLSLSRRSGKRSKDEAPFVRVIGLWLIWCELVSRDPSWVPNSTYLYLDFYLLCQYTNKKDISKVICYPTLFPIDDMMLKFRKNCECCPLLLFIELMLAFMLRLLFSIVKM